MRSMHVRLSVFVMLSILGFVSGLRGGVEESGPPPHVVPALLADRAKHASLGAEGGGVETEAAVRAGLDWLARHQHDDGYWDADGFFGGCAEVHCTGEGNAFNDIGVTGLALLAFLADGQTFKKGEHRVVIREGVKYLKMVQDPEGCFGPRTTQHFVYNHAIATLAWVEIYALTGSTLFRESGQQAVDFILKAQNPEAGWRYGVRPGDSDTSITGWMLTALHAAKEAGFTVDEESFAGAAKFLDEMVDPKTGRVGYTSRGSGPARLSDLLEEFPPQNSESLTALGMYSRLLLARNTKRELARTTMMRGRRLCLARLPRWEVGHIDMYYWYYGSLALFQIGGSSWKKWSDALETALLPHQATKGCAKGSWDPAGPWGPQGGRVYTTALCTLMLQNYYRYGRIRNE